MPYVDLWRTSEIVAGFFAKSSNISKSFRKSFELNRSFQKFTRIKRVFDLLCLQISAPTVKNIAWLR